MDELVIILEGVEGLTEFKSTIDYFELERDELQRVLLHLSSFARRCVAFWIVETFDRNEKCQLRVGHSLPLLLNSHQFDIGRQPVAVNAM